MTALRILVVDNSHEMHSIIEDHFSEVPPETAVVTPAMDVAAALAAIKADFFHLAFVDLKLGDGENFDSGFEVLQALREEQPQCQRVAMSRFAAAQPHSALRAVSPADTLAHALVAKQAMQRDDFIEIALRTHDRVVAPAIRFSGLDPILEALAPTGRIFKGTTRTRESIQAEVSFLLCSLLKPRVINQDDDPTEVALELTTQGFSGAVAFVCTPMFGDRAGSKCFVKIGSAASIHTEAERFRGFVQLSVPLSVRVELLDSTTGSTLGAVAYSFAGGSSAELESFDQLASRQGVDDSAVLEVIDKLFDSESGTWYKTRGRSVAPLSYFENELRSKFLARQPIVQSIGKSLARKFHGQFENPVGMTDTASKLTVGDTRLFVPNDSLLGREVFASPTNSCLVHGDLHGANILVAEDGSVYLIDFSHAGFGPLAHDAAVLNGSIRLWDSTQLPDRHDNLWVRLGSIVQQERAIADEYAANWPNAGPTTASGGWRTTAEHLDRQLRSQFGRDLPLEAVRATYLLQAARLLTIPLDDMARLRLLAWFTGVLESMQGEG